MKQERYFASSLAKKSPRLGHGMYYDPLYGHIPTSPEIRQLLDLEVYQRLRGIQQLSTLSLAFPGATHTRFEHSVGVGHLAKPLHELLQQRALDTSDQRVNDIHLGPVTLAALQVAAMLHDIGHGPFGHVFEMYTRRLPPEKRWDHEEWGKALIRGTTREGEKPQRPEFRQIPEFLQELQGRYRNDYPEDPALGLLEPANIARIAFGEEPKLQSDDLSSSYYFLKDVIPSAYGIDRLDYLRRDAFHTGVKTGDVDIWEIVGNLHLRYVDGRCQLFLFPSAAPSFESLLRTRDAVYRQLYYNPVNRGAQELLIRALLHLDKSPDDIAFLTDYELLEVFSSSKRPFLKEVAERIRFRILYEIHPLGCHDDLVKYQLRIDRYWKSEGGWREFEGLEETIASGAEMSGHHRVFFDLVPIPAMKKEDLEAKLFLGRDESEASNLMTELPHIGNLFQGKVSQHLAKVEQYNKSVSRFFVAFPYDHIASEIESIRSGDEVDRRAAVEDLYERKVRPLVRGFLEKCLEAEEGDYDDLQSKSAEYFLAYFMDLLEK